MKETLGSVCQFLNGGTPSKDVASYFEGNIPWITSADIVSPITDLARSFITEEAIRKSATNKVTAGTVLLVTRTGVGKVAIAGTDLCFSQDITALIPDRTKLDAGYLVQYLQTKKTYFERFSRGATIKGITRDVVADLTIPLPPLPEQIRIAAILDQADALRAKRREALEQLDRLQQSIFIEMFGDLTKNPMQFPVHPFGGICDVRDGTHDSPKFVESGFPLVTTKNLKYGTVDFSNVSFISAADFDAINKRSKVDMGDILMPMIGTIGNPVLVEEEPAFAIKNVALIKFSRHSPDSLYILNLLQSEYFGRLVVSKNKGGTQKFLSLGDIRSLSIPLPPVDLQVKFSKIIKQVKLLKTKHMDSCTELDNLFASLQHRAFQGEL